MKMILIVNPNSGTKNSKEQLIKAIAIFNKYGHQTEIYITQCQNDAYYFLKNTKNKFDVVCVFGGDGTINEVTSALIKKKDRPLIGYFPSGTMNDFGSNFDLDENWEMIAERICRGKYKEFDVGKFGDHRYFNYVAAFGALTNVSYTTKRDSKEKFGTLAYIFEGISRLTEIKPVPVKIKINGKEKNYKVLFALVFSGGRVAGTELVSKRKSSVNDGEFNVMIVDYVDAPVTSAPDLLRTVAEQKKYIHWYKASEMEFEFENNIDWTIDGEKAPVNKKVKITNINKALRMLS